MTGTRDLKKRDAFDGAHSEWLAAHAAMNEPGDFSEAELNRRYARRDAAELAFIVAPAAYPDAVWLKFALVEALVLDERVAGESTYPLTFLALASLKTDLLAIGLKED